MMEHTDLLNKLIADLEEQGCELFIEHQNGFRVESPRTGAVIGGRADLIARFPDGRVVVYDAKTGQESASHIAQVQLYMYLLPKSNLVQWKGMGRKAGGRCRLQGRPPGRYSRRKRGRRLRCPCYGLDAEDDCSRAAQAGAERAGVPLLRADEGRLP